MDPDRVAADGTAAAAAAAGAPGPARTAVFFGDWDQRRRARCGPESPLAPRSGPGRPRGRGGEEEENTGPARPARPAPIRAPSGTDRAVGR